MKNTSNKRLTKKRQLMIKKLGYLQIGLLVLMFAVAGMMFLKRSGAYTPIGGLTATCSNFTVTKTTVQTGEVFGSSVSMKNNGSGNGSGAFSPNVGTALFDLGGKFTMTGGGITKNYAVNETANFSLTLTAPSVPGSYQFQPIMGVVYLGYYASPCTAKTINVVAPTTPTPPTPTPPTPTPPAPKPRPRTIPATPAPVADTQKPTAPTDFSGNIDNTSGLINLSWTASTDNIAVSGYQIERSLNQTEWSVLAANVTEVQYQDATADFLTLYYYRISAVDAAGNISDFATTEVSSRDFVANVSPKDGATLTSEDKTVTVIIPPDAVKVSLFCSVTSDDSQLAPSIKGYTILAGPYLLNCRNEAGDVVNNFDKPINMTANVSASSRSKVAKVAYFGQKDNKWIEIKGVKRDKKSGIDNAVLGSYTKFVIMGKTKKTSIWLVLLSIAMVIAGIALVLAALARWKLKHNSDSTNDNYRRQNMGG